MALVAWGDRWTAPNGPPVLFSHRTCGHGTVATVVCSAQLARDDVDFRPGRCLTCWASASMQSNPSASSR